MIHHGNHRKNTFLKARVDYWLCLMLVIVTLSVYWPVLNFEFISFDDSIYVTENRYIRRGLTAEGINWAIIVKDREYSTYWHPLTWLSHMLDYQLFGLNAGMHHFANLVFHMVNSLVLFMVFRRMTGALWQSVFVAALFALHPLNVESVAWVSERKNVLSTFFGVLTMFSYTTYTARPSLSRYLLTLWIFILGLMAKPMLVTMPFVLLLLDYWPIGRLHFKAASPEKKHVESSPSILHSTGVRLILEKIPFLCFSLAVVYLSSKALQSMHTMVTTGTVPLKLRIFNALVGYFNYILKMLWPQKLAVLYPYPNSVPVWQVSGAVLFLVGVSLLVIFRRKKQPYLLVGWLWYLGTLIPVSGLIQGGLWPEMADRWAYIPLVGLFIMIAWGSAQMVSGWNRKRIALAIMGATVLIILMVVTGIQVRYWKNSTTLYEHTLRVTDHNFFIHNNLGVALKNQGQLTEAMVQYQKALGINPKHVSALNNLGNALEVQGRLDEASQHYREALRIDPYSSITYNNLGNISIKKGDIIEAIQMYEKALQLKSNYKEAYYNLGNALSLRGRLNDALGPYYRALRLDPQYVEVHVNLGNNLFRLGRVDEAVRHYTQAIQIDPEKTMAVDNLRNLMAVEAEKNHAVLKWQQTLEKNPGDASVYYALGGAYKRKGQLDKASAHYQKAISLEPKFYDALKDLAIVYAMQGKFNRAREFFHKCLLLQPNRWEAYYYTAGTYARQDKINESVQWLKQAVGKGFDDWHLLQIDQNFDTIRTTSYYAALMQGR